MLPGCLISLQARSLAWQQVLILRSLTRLRNSDSYLDRCLLRSFCLPCFSEIDIDRECNWSLMSIASLAGDGELESQPQPSAILLESWRG